MELKNQNSSNSLETETGDLLQPEGEQVGGLSPVEEKVVRMRYGIPLEDSNSPLPFAPANNRSLRELELKALQALLAKGKDKGKLKV